MSFKSFMFFIGGFCLSILFYSEPAFSSDLQEEGAEEKIFFKPILSGSVQSSEDWTYDIEGRVKGPQGQEVLPYNQSKLLRDTGEYGPEAVQSLFNQSILHVVEYEDGNFGLTVNLQLLGGGNGGSSEGGGSGGNDRTSSRVTSGFGGSVTTGSGGSVTTGGSFGHSTRGDMGSSGGDRELENARRSLERQMSEASGMNVTVRFLGDSDTSSRDATANYRSSSNLSSGNDTRDRGVGGNGNRCGIRGGINSNNYGYVGPQVSPKYAEYPGQRSYVFPCGDRLEHFVSLLRGILRRPDDLLTHKKKSKVGLWRYTWIGHRVNRKGVRYIHSMNHKGDLGLLDPKRGIVYTIFQEDRQCTDCFLPHGYPKTLRSRDTDLGGWLLKRYIDYKLTLNHAIIGGVSKAHKGPIHRVLSEPEHRTTEAMLATFGIVLNTMGPDGLYQLGKKYTKTNPNSGPALMEAANWLYMFRKPEKYFYLSMEKPIGQFLGTTFTHDNIPTTVRAQWWKRGFENLTGNMAGASAILDPRNGLAYPFFSVYYDTLPGALLPKGYEPQEDHENLGLSFLQACGGCGQDILAELLGIPKQAHAVGELAIAQGTCHILSRTVGLALTTMLGKELFADSVLQKLDEGHIQG